MRTDPDSVAGIFYKRFEPRIRLIVRRMMGTSPDQHDVVQQVFFDLVRSGFELREPEKLPSWIHSITACAVYNELRRRRLRRTLDETLATSVVRNLVWDVEARDLLTHTAEMIERLPRNERSAFTMRIVEGRTFDEVAKLLGCSIPTIKRRFARANRRMLSMIARNKELLALSHKSATAGAPFARRSPRKASEPLPPARPAA